MKIKIFVAHEIQYFEIGTFYFNSYVYYLTRGFIALTRAFNLLTRAFNLPARAFNLATRAFSLLTRGFELVTRGFEFVTRELKLVTRVLLFHFLLVSTSTEIIKDVTILKVIEWIQTSWADVSEKTINNCFEKCGFGNPNVVDEKTVDHEFEEPLQELSSDVTVEEFMEFYDCIDTFEPEVSTSSVDWREELQAKYYNVLTIKMLNLTTIALNPKTMRKM